MPSCTDTLKQEMFLRFQWKTISQFSQTNSPVATLNALDMLIKTWVLKPFWLWCTHCDRFNFARWKDSWRTSMGLTAVGRSKSKSCILYERSRFSSSLGSASSLCNRVHLSLFWIIDANYELYIMIETCDK